MRKALLSKNRLTHIANPELFCPGYHENDVLCKLQNMNTRGKIVSQGLGIIPHISWHEVNFTPAPLSLRKIRDFVVFYIIIQLHSVEYKQESPLGILTGHSDPPHP